MFFGKRPTALCPWRRCSDGRRADGARHVLCPPIGRAAPFGSLSRNPGYLQVADIMALASSRRMVAGISGSSTANVFAAVGNQSMTKVLLIEDDGETAEEITAELTDRGFEVEWSANGIEGLDKARSSHPDAMIVDRLLPGMDGLTVIEALGKEQVRTRVLVLGALCAG